MINASGFGGTALEGYDLYLIYLLNFSLHAIGYADTGIRILASDAGLVIKYTYVFICIHLPIETRMQKAYLAYVMYNLGIAYCCTQSQVLMMLLCLTCNHEHV